MKKIFLIALLAITFTITLKSQDGLEENKDAIAEMSFYTIKHFKDALKNWQPELDTIIEYDIDHFLKTPLVEREQQDILTEINSNSKIELIYNDGFMNRYSVRLECEIPSDGEYPYNSKFKLRLLNNNMTIGQDTFPLKQSALDGSSEKKISYLMMSDYQIDTTQIIGGNCEFEILFHSGYEKKELTRKDIGTSFKMQSKEFKLIDIVDNYVIIEDNSNKKTHDFGIINFVTKDSVVQSGNFKSELKYGLKKDGNYKHRTDMASKSAGLVAEIYKIYFNNPQIQKDEFVKTFYPLISEEVMLNYYHILISKKPIGEKFIVYLPTYETEDFAVKY